MNVFAFKEANASAESVLLDGGIITRVVTLSALALLKLTAWVDPNRQYRDRDASDLDLIFRNYRDAGNDYRQHGEFASWLDEDDFQFHLVGPRLLGRDIRKLLSDDARIRLAAPLVAEIDPELPGRLAQQMNRNDPDRAREMLAAFHWKLIGRTRS